MGDAGEYVRAGDGVRAFLPAQLSLQRRLGWVPEQSDTKPPGKAFSE